VKCKHHDVDLTTTIDDEGDEKTVSRVCLGCSAWLPLGPSNDEPEAVRVEMHLAALLAEIPQLWEPSDWEHVIASQVDHCAEIATHTNEDA
jgi:hypothetical protein